jgi:hypothetical protein
MAGPRWNERTALGPAETRSRRPCWNRRRGLPCSNGCWVALNEEQGPGGGQQRVLRCHIWRERAAGEGAFGRSGGGAVSDDRMHGGRRVRARSSAPASCSMARAAAELDVPLHGARGGAPCISTSSSMAIDPQPRCLDLVPPAGDATPSLDPSQVRLPPPPPPRARPRLRRTAGQPPTARRSETGRFQFQILIFGRTCKVLKYVRTLLQKQIYTVATSLNSGRREYYLI